MTDHGSTLAITRLARRGCPVAARAGCPEDGRAAGLTVAARADLAGLAVLVAEDPRENRAVPRCLPLRRAAPMPPPVAAAAAAAVPSVVPRSAAVLCEPRLESDPPRLESRSPSLESRSPRLESLAPGPESEPLAVPADPSDAVAGYGIAAGSS